MVKSVPRQFFVLLLKCEFSTFNILKSFVAKVTRVWSVNHSIHKRNENEFFTWVSLGIFLLGSVNHSFHKRNENYFFTWVSLGIFLVWSLNLSFHKRNENDFFTWVSLDMVAVCVPLLLTFETWWFINKVPPHVLTTVFTREWKWLLHMSIFRHFLIVKC